MRIRLLGTGSADGLPNPFCDCATCADARRSGRTRASSSALIDDVLLIDPGPGAGPAAGQQGASLREVEHVLVTHGHPDHLAPEFLLWRSWIPGLHPLRMWGPAHAIDRCTHWLADYPVEVTAIDAGTVLTLETRHGTYTVHAIPAAHGIGNGDAYAEEALLYDVTGPDGDRLLYATDTGPLPASTIALLAGRRFDAVLIEETFGHVAEAPGHLNIARLGTTLEAFRAHEVITDRTDVIAFHLSHHNPPARELDAALAEIGARAVDDGTVVDTRRPRRARDLVIGGARSGKSTYAERLAAREHDVTYVATGGARPDDTEWVERIAAHRARRPVHWATVETIDPTQALGEAAAMDTLIIECVGTWLTAQLDAVDAWAMDPADAAAHADRAIDAFIAAIEDCEARLIIVSNEVGQGVVPATPAGRLFRDVLGVANRRIADVCDRTTFLVAGRAIDAREMP